jgi:hypothetical protein
MLVFFDICGIVHHAFPRASHQHEVLQYLRENIWLGFSTTTMHHHQALLIREFLTNHVIASAPALLARYSSCRLLTFPEDEEAAERSPFSHHCRDPARIA